MKWTRDATSRQRGQGRAGLGRRGAATKCTSFRFPLINSNRKIRLEPPHSGRQQEENAGMKCTWNRAACLAACLQPTTSAQQTHTLSLSFSYPLSLSMNGLRGFPRAPEQVEVNLVASTQNRKCDKSRMQFALETEGSTSSSSNNSKTATLCG